jgi:molybdopterin converting factor small subunit
VVDVVTVRYFAGARAAAGVESEAVPAGTVDELLDRLARRHGERLARILPGCSYLIDGVACHDRAAALATGCTIDVLPPFAGG